MDINECKTKVLSINAEAKSLLDSVSNPDYQKCLNDLIVSLHLLVEFVNDDLNIAVLKAHCEKAADTPDQSPLDCLCRNVLDKLEEIDGLLKPDIFDCLRSENSQSKIPRIRPFNAQELQLLIIKLKDTHLQNLLSAYEVLKHLEGHSKTLIILGPNGSGKTTFANYLKNLDAHIKVVPASKPIKATGHIPSIYNSTLINYNDELYSGNTLDQNLLQKLIIGMCTEHDDIARKHYDTGVKERDSTYEKVKKIFDDFFEVKLDNSGFSAKEMRAKKDGLTPFSFNNMSDGERVAFFYISTVVAAPNQSFIVVDEPENHLNPAIYNKIWDRLVEIRNDCQFIFISHTIDFISARSNYELVKIKDFQYPDKFEFEFLGSALEEIRTELIVEIVGSRKPILFCEGKKSDFDYKIYESLFGSKYTLIPTGNCLSVEKSVEACNLHATAYGIQSAIGIIDSDLKSPEELERLKAKRVFTLKCNEIEMLLVDEAVFKKTLEQVFKPIESFDSFKNLFFSKMSERKEHIIKRLTKTYIDERLTSSFIDDKNNKTKEEIKTNLSNIFGSLDVDEIWKDCEEKITTIITDRQYDEALRYCCLEHGEVIAGLGNRFVSDYPAIALGVLRDNSQLSEHLRSKYFQEIEM